MRGSFNVRDCKVNVFLCFSASFISILDKTTISDQQQWQDTWSKELLAWASPPTPRPPPRSPPRPPPRSPLRPALLRFVSDSRLMIVRFGFWKKELSVWDRAGSLEVKFPDSLHKRKIGEPDWGCFLAMIQCWLFPSQVPQPSESENLTSCFLACPRRISAISSPSSWKWDNRLRISTSSWK